MIRRYLPRLLTVLACLLCGITCAALSFHAFGWSTTENDDTAFLLQARALANGMMSLPAPPVGNMLLTPFTLAFSNGRMYDAHFPGNAWALTLGELAGFAWLVPFVLTPLAALLTAKYCTEIADRRLGRLVFVFALFSPSTLGMGALIFSESMSRFCLAAFAFCLFRSLNYEHLSRGALLFVAAAGAAFGFAAVTRPFPAISFGLPVFLLYFVYLLRRRGAKQFVLRNIITALCGLPLLAAFLLWNYHLAGGALTLAHPNKPGFSDSYPADLAVERAWRKLLLRIPYAALGWGWPLSGEGLAPLYPFGDYSQAGLMVRSGETGQFAILRAVNHPEGTTTFGLLDDEKQENQTIKRFFTPYRCSHGRCAARLELRVDGTHATGVLTNPRTGEEHLVGPMAVDLPPPLEVGVFAGVGARGGRGRACFKNLSVVSGGNESEAVRFNGAALAGPTWKVDAPNLEPPAATPQGLCFRTRPLDSTAAEPQRRPQRVFYMTGERSVAARAEMEVNWIDWSAPLRALARGDGTGKDALLGLAALSPWLLSLLPCLFSRPRAPWFALWCALLLSVFLHSLLPFDTGGDALLVPWYVRYHADVILLCMIPLAMQGLLILRDAFVGRSRRLIRRGLPWVVAGLLLANTAASDVRLFIESEIFARAWDIPPGVRTVLPRLVNQLDDERLVVFVSHAEGGSPLPVGRAEDYPFEPLESARAVYFSIANLEEWRAEYDRWFQGRTPYLYDKRGLHKLQL